MASWPRTDNGRDCFLEDSGNNVAPAFSRPRARADSAGFIQLHKSRLLSNNHAAQRTNQQSEQARAAGVCRLVRIMIRRASGKHLGRAALVLATFVGRNF